MKIYSTTGGGRRALGALTCGVFITGMSSVCAQDLLTTPSFIVNQRWLLNVDLGVVGSSYVAPPPPPSAIGDVSTIIASTQTASTSTAAYTEMADEAPVNNDVREYEPSPSRPRQRERSEQNRVTSSRQNQGRSLQNRSADHSSPTLPALTPDLGPSYDPEHPVANAINYPSNNGWNFSLAGGYSSDLLARGVSMAGKNTFNDTAREILDNWSSVTDEDLISAGFMKEGGARPPKNDFARPDGSDPTMSLLSFAANKGSWNLGVQYVRSLSSDLVPFWETSFQNTDAYEEFRVSATYSHALLADNWLNGSASAAIVYYPNEAFWGVQHQGLITLGLSVDRLELCRPYLSLFSNITTDSEGIANLTRLSAEGVDLVKGYGATLGVRGSRHLHTFEGLDSASIKVDFVYDANLTAKYGYFSEQEGLTSGILAVSLPVTFSSNLTVTPSLQYVTALQDISPKLRGFTGDKAYGSDFNDPGFVWGVNASYSF